MKLNFCLHLILFKAIISNRRKRVVKKCRNNYFKRHR